MGIEKFRRRIGLPGMSGKDRFRGITSIASGDAFVVVSASDVASGYPIFATAGRTTVASLRVCILSINSVVTGTSFCIVSDKATTDTHEVCYEIVR